MGRLVRINKKRRMLSDAAKAASPVLPDMFMAVPPRQPEIMIAPNPEPVEPATAPDEPVPVAEPFVDPYAGLFREITLDETHSGGTYTIIGKGDAYFHLREDAEQPQYKWIVIEQSDNFRLTVESKREFQDKAIIIRIFQFEVSKGEGKVVLHLKNPWNLQEESQKMVEFTIIGA